MLEVLRKSVAPSRGPYSAPFLSRKWIDCDTKADAPPTSWSRFRSFSTRTSIPSYGNNSRSIRSSRESMDAAP
jgi:hypothetical protein